MCCCFKRIYSPKEKCAIVPIMSSVGPSFCNGVEKFNIAPKCPLSSPVEVESIGSPRVPESTRNARAPEMTPDTKAT